MTDGANPVENGPAAGSSDPGVVAEDAGPVRGSAADLPERLGCLSRAYGDFIERIDGTGGDGPVVVMKDGARIPWDDGKEKTFDEKLESPDLEDQLSIPYPLGESSSPPVDGDDPGRIRVEALFEAVYGGSARDVKERLVEVPWLPGGGGVVMFNERNGAAGALRSVAARLEAKLTADLRKYALPCGGTFSWRPIAGTHRRSAHSYGIAIDLNVKYSSYWRWSLGRASAPVYHNRIPRVIVEEFEEGGFVWGGKWYHFDTMHFEYRPELLDSACTR